MFPVLSFEHQPPSSSSKWIALIYSAWTRCPGLSTAVSSLGSRCRRCGPWCLGRRRWWLRHLLAGTLRIAGRIFFDGLCALGLREVCQFLKESSPSRRTGFDPCRTSYKFVVIVIQRTEIWLIVQGQTGVGSVEGQWVRVHLLRGFPG